MPSWCGMPVHLHFFEQQKNGARHAKVSASKAAAPQPVEDDLSSIMLEDVKVGASAKLDWWTNPEACFSTGD